MQSGLKIAIAGKGGVGKTTVCAVLARLFAEDGFDVLAVDADPDTNLCVAMGIDKDAAPEPLINMKALIGERTGTGVDAVGVYFKMNPKVSDLPEKYWHEVDGLKVLVLGGIYKAASGCACAEGTFLRSLLTHTILQRKEVVLVDLDAGVESMGRASIRGIDILVVVVEPGSRSIGTAVNIANMSQDLGVRQVAVIANKITDASQVEAIKSQLGGIAVLAAVDYNASVQQADLDRKSVFGVDSEMVEKLDGGRGALMKMVGAESESA